MTPDSYVDGGRYGSLDAVVARAGTILQQGGDIVEIGGESTGPGSADVSGDEELRRVLPAVSAVREAFPAARICVDTWKSAVAIEALDAGADMINDVTAGRGDDRMFDVISRSRCPYVMMYAKDPTSRTVREDRDYDDVVAHVSAFLAGRIAQARARDIHYSQLILDPGLGHFVSAKPEYSFRILAGLRAFTELGPVLVSPSRKSFLAGTVGVPVADRLPATLAATTAAVLNGASFIRTHDVKETRLACDAACEIRS